MSYHALATAVQFLTRVPLPGGMNRPGADRRLLTAAVPYFPLVGGLIGTFTAAVMALSLQLWPPIVAVLLGLLFEALLTGAFHEDAVADSGDAFGGGWTREDVLRILKDSRIGSFGALALLLMVGLRAAGLMMVPAELLFAFVPASTAIGRWAILVLMVLVPPVPDREGLSKDVGERIRGIALVFGSLAALPFAAFAASYEPLRTGAAVAIVALLMLAWGRYVQSRIGGITGDALGCGCYIAQVAVLLVLAAGTNRP